MDIDIAYGHFPFAQQSNTVEERSNNSEGLFGVSDEKNFIDMIVDQIEKDDKGVADLKNTEDSRNANKAQNRNAEDKANALAANDAAINAENVTEADVKVLTFDPTEKEGLIAALSNMLTENKSLTDTQKNDLHKIIASLMAGETNKNDLLMLSNLIPNDKVFNALQKDLKTLTESFDLAIEDNTGTVELSESESRQQAKEFKSYLESLLMGIPAENRPDVRLIPQNILTNVQEGLDFTPSTQNATPSLIATDLTPEALHSFLTQLQQQTSEGNSMIVGVVKLGPEPSDASTIYLPQVIVTPKNNGQAQAEARAGLNTIKQNLSLAQAEQSNAQQAQAASAAAKVASPALNFTGSMEDIAHQLNNIEVGAGNNMARTEDKMGIKPGAARMNALTPSSNNNALSNQPTTPASPQASNTGQPLPQHMMLSGDQTSQVQITSLLSGNTAFSYSLLDASYEGDLFALNQISSPTMQQATSMVTQAQHASQPHPGTQAVVATIAKAVSNGDTKHITVRLDPPDLGRVDVKLEFDGANKVKAILVFEKQETFNMMQRDAHLLEKALQDSGLDAQSSDLSFELAEDGHFSNQGGQDNDQLGKNSDHRDDQEAAEIETLIETGVNWHIDEATGLTRYDILV